MYGMEKRKKKEDDEEGQVAEAAGPWASVPSDLLPEILSLPVALPVQVRVQGLARALLRPEEVSPDALRLLLLLPPPRPLAPRLPQPVRMGPAARWSTPRSVSCGATKRSRPCTAAAASSSAAAGE
jgi:hypothetical protein